jgi:hypothetical protein
VVASGRVLNGVFEKNAQIVIRSPDEGRQALQQQIKLTARGKGTGRLNARLNACPTSAANYRFAVVAQAVSPAFLTFRDLCHWLLN